VTLEIPVRGASDVTVIALGRAHVTPKSPFDFTVTFSHWRPGGKREPSGQQFTRYKRDESLPFPADIFGIQDVFRFSVEAGDPYIIGFWVRTSQPEVSISIRDVILVATVVPR
jgi:hypothetical protein